MPQVRESSAMTVHAEARQEYAPGGRRRIHVCPYCSADKARTYSTFLDWKNHLSDTHHHCIEAGDSLLRAEYAAGFKLDQWGRFHELDGSENDQAYKRVRQYPGATGERWPASYPTHDAPAPSSAPKHQPSQEPTAQPARHDQRFS